MKVASNGRDDEHDDGSVRLSAPMSQPKRRRADGVQRRRGVRAKALEGAGHPNRVMWPYGL